MKSAPSPKALCSIHLGRRRRGKKGVEGEDFWADRKREKREETTHFFPIDRGYPFPSSFRSVWFPPLLHFPSGGGDSFVVYFLLFLLLLCPDILRMFVGQGERRKGKGADRRIRGTISPMMLDCIFASRLLDLKGLKAEVESERGSASVRSMCTFVCRERKVNFLPFPGGKMEEEEGLFDHDIWDDDTWGYITRRWRTGHG